MPLPGFCGYNHRSGRLPSRFGEAQFNLAAASLTGLSLSVSAAGEEQTGMALDRLRAALHPLREALLGHPIYGEMHGAQALRTFMEHHIFAVWDFMSLVKSLQQRLCCVAVPWVPGLSGTDCRFINEIVLAEETDEDGRGGHASHFDLYRRAMTRFGANTSRIDRLISEVTLGTDVRSALHRAEVPVSIQTFVGDTFEVIEGGDLCRIASNFTFGREDLLPEVFQKIVDEISEQSACDLDDFQFYLRRHVELDGDEHGPMAARLIESLCGADESKWRSAEEAAVAALRSRLALWDGIHAAIKNVPALALGIRPSSGASVSTR
jgi:hypothetical protein